MLRTESYDCLADLENIFKSLPVDGSPQTIDANLTLLKRIGARDNCARMIERILGNPGLLADVASRSYRHVNHYDKIVLVGSDKLHGYRLTFHLWNPPYEEKELKKESIHDHRFNFWSMILTGVLTSENFTESVGGDLLRHYRYIPENRNVRNFYQFIGETRLLKTEPARREGGESYYQPSPGIHRVVLPSSMTCTLVLRGPRQRAFTNVFRTDHPKVDTYVNNSMYSEKTVEEKIGAILNVISAG